MEDKIPPKVYSFVAIIGTLYDKNVLVIGSDDDIKYIQQYHTDKYHEQNSPESSSEAVVTGKRFTY